MAVQERLQLVFGMFPRFGTVAKVMRMLEMVAVSICHVVTGTAICSGREQRSHPWRRS